MEWARRGIRTNAVAPGFTVTEGALRKMNDEEAQALMFGGGDSVANTLMVGLFHVLDQPELYKRLKDEVYQAWPSIENPPTAEALESLPVLTATIKESLRCAPGVPSSLLRVVPPSGAMIGGKNIPAGTRVGMSTVLVHQSS